MPVKFRCPQCQQLVGVSNSLAGAAIACPQCRCRLRVPGTPVATVYATQQHQQQGLRQTVRQTSAPVVVQYPAGAQNISLRSALQELSSLRSPRTPNLVSAAQTSTVAAGHPVAVAADQTQSATVDTFSQDVWFRELPPIGAEITDWVTDADDVTETEDAGENVDFTAERFPVGDEIDEEEILNRLVESPDHGRRDVLSEELLADMRRASQQRSLAAVIGSLLVMSLLFGGGVITGWWAGRSPDFARQTRELSDRVSAKLFSPMAQENANSIDQDPFEHAVSRPVLDADDPHMTPEAQ
ncbi:MAG: hypothetical protein R3C49_26140 [Planctomycetaceae bacterium]